MYLKEHLFTCAVFSSPDKRGLIWFLLNCSHELQSHCLIWGGTRGVKAHTGFVVASEMQMISFSLKRQLKSFYFILSFWQTEMKVRESSGSKGLYLTKKSPEFKATAERTQPHWKVWYHLSANHNGAVLGDDRCTNEALSFPKYCKPWSFTLLCFYRNSPIYKMLVKWMWDKRGGNRAN